MRPAAAVTARRDAPDPHRASHEPPGAEWRRPADIVAAREREEARRFMRGLAMGMGMSILFWIGVLLAALALA